MGGPGSGRKSGSGEGVRKANNSLKQKKALFGSNNKQTIKARKTLHYQKMVANRNK
jgi:hypothetical protein